MIKRIIEKIIDKKIGIFKQELERTKREIQLEWDGKYSFGSYMTLDRQSRIADLILSSVILKLIRDQDFINIVVEAINRVQLRGRNE